MRINKFLAGRLGITRREGDMLVAHGFVTHDGEEIPPGFQVQKSMNIVVDYKGSERIIKGEAPPYILVYKPARHSVIPQHKNIKSKQTIWDVLPSAFAEYIPLGGLGFDEEGLVIMVRDTEAGIVNSQSQEYLVQTVELIHTMPDDVEAEFIKPNDILHKKLGGRVNPDLPIYRITKNRTRSSVSELLKKSGIRCSLVMRSKDGDYSIDQIPLSRGVEFVERY